MGQSFILGHFKRNDAEDGRYIMLLLDDSEEDECFRKLPREFRRCYVTDDKLAEIVSNSGADWETAVASYIPDRAYLKAGEFGEIIAFFIIKDYYLPDEVEGPMKWRFKNDKNKPVQYSDLIVFSFKDDNKYSPEDKLVCAEVKTKSTKTGRHPIQAAIAGSEKDSTSRLALLLIWLRDKYIQAGDETGKRKLERFIKSPELEYGPYIRHFKAVAVLCKSLIEDECKKEFEMPEVDGAFELVLVGIPKLKKFYERIYEEILNTDLSEA